MAKLPSAFNSTDKDDMNDFSVIKAGDYPAQIVKSDYVETKKKDGHRLTLQLKIIAGPSKGKMLFAGLNLDNPNVNAVEMAEKELATICRAVGKVGIADSMELHGIPMTVVVGIEPASEQYPEKNIIQMYKPIDASTAQPASKDDTEEGGEPKKRW